MWNFNHPAFTSLESFFCSAFERFWSPWGRRLSGWTDSHIETREKYCSGVCSGFSHTGCTNWMAWWSLKAAFLQGIEPGVSDWTCLSRRGKNFGSTDWSCHSHQQYDLLQETQQGFYFPFTKLSSCAWARSHASGTRMHLSWGKRSPVSSKSLSLLWPGRSCENLLSNQTQTACFLCGESSQSFNSSKCVKVPVKLVFGDGVIETMALIYSGAAGNFIDAADFAKSHDLPLIPCKSPLAVEALDWRHLGAGKVLHTTNDICLITGVMHSEILHFFIIQAPNNPVVLGLPWLQLHKPQISWMEGQITHWSVKCFTQCLQILEPLLIEAATVKLDPLHSTNIPSDYVDLA